METQPVVHNTFVMERTYPASPERVFQAFSIPERKQKWYAQGSHLAVEHYELDFRVGGREITKSRFGEGTPFPGAALINESTIQDIVPERRIIVASSMSLGDHHISASLSTFEILPDEKGTRLVLTEQTAFLEGADGAERREQGWRALLDRLGSELTGTGTPHAQAKA